MIDSFLGPGTVWPELSPCQPLERPMSPRARSDGTIVSRPARLGTSCHRRRLVFDKSIGFTNWNEAVYSTMPRALRGASVMSWMIALCGSLGSSSPKARPVSIVLSRAAENRALECGRDLCVDDN